MGDLYTIVGKTPTHISQSEDEIVMTFSDNSVGHFYHEQDCCEYVCVDDVNGDWGDLIGKPILVAEERWNDEPEEGCSGGDESNTWTFYTFRGIGGSVDVRWHGSSNGYYSESVNFKLTENKATTNE
jgi:hypothetical protein